MQLLVECGLLLYTVHTDRPCQSCRFPCIRYTSPCTSKEALLNLVNRMSSETAASAGGQGGPGGIIAVKEMWMLATSPFSWNSYNAAESVDCSPKFHGPQESPQALGLGRDLLSSDPNCDSFASM